VARAVDRVIVHGIAHYTRLTSGSSRTLFVKSSAWRKKLT
jgi:hypothetical protein